MKKNPWIDKWTKKAKEMGYPARSVFKLMEIQKKYHLIKKGDIVLDLGAAPGSWSKYVCKLVGPKGKVIGVDLQKLNLNLPNFFFIQKDVFELSKDDFLSLGIKKFDIILSDMAPKTTGDKFGDHIRSIKLVERALKISLEFLKFNRSFLAKVFEGPNLADLKREIEKNFKSVKLFKPKSSRKGSKEIFIIAQNLKNRG